MKSLRKLGEEVRDNNIEKGWRDEDRTFGDNVALLHSEVSEALEAYRNWGLHDRTRRSQIGEGGYVHYFKPEGVGSELADILIRLLDMADLYGIDLYAEYERKMAYNRTRPYRHGGKKL